MRKWFIGIATLAILFTAATYVIIPANLVISQLVTVDCSINGVNRVINAQTRWSTWWPPVTKSPTASTNAKDTVEYNGYRYMLQRRFYNSVEVDILKEPHNLVTSRINILNFTPDSVAIAWKCKIEASKNPLQRINQYRQAVMIKKNMDSILQHLKIFLGSTRNVYGFNIREIISKDSMLVYTERLVNSYPSTKEVYQVVDALKKYIAKENASINDVPMLHVKVLPDHEFAIMAAIPVNKRVKETGSIVNKRFVPWKTLVADVNGGILTINKAMVQMQVYIQDYHRNPMALPFESLITDRSREADTLKWVTRICQPVS